MTPFINTRLLWIFLLAGASFSAIAANSTGMLADLTDGPSAYTGVSVAENVAKMDTDHNGFADVAEVRAYLMLKHGAGYQKAVLDRWELAAKGKSCGTSLLKALSSD